MQVYAFRQTDRTVIKTPVYATTVRNISTALIAVGQTSPGGGRTVATADHMFFERDGGWVAAGALRASDQILQLPSSQGHSSGLVGVSDYGQWPVVSPEAATVEQAADAVVPVYNIFPEETHTFFVGAERMLVHSCVGLNIAGKELDRALVGSDDDSSVSGAAAAVLEDEVPVLVLDAFAPALNIIPARAARLQTAGGKVADMVQPRALGCLQYSPWTQLVGQLGKHALVVLDTEGRRLEVLSVAELQRFAAGDMPCDREQLVLGSIDTDGQGDTPTQVLLSPRLEPCSADHDSKKHNCVARSIYVTHFISHVVEHYSIEQDTHSGELLQLRRASSVTLQHSGVGLSGLAVCGVELSALCVTNVAWSCHDQQCLRPHYGQSQVHVVPLSATGELAAKQEVEAFQPSIKNPAKLYRHGQHGAMFALGFGNSMTSKAGVQRLYDSETGVQAGPVIELPLPVYWHAHLTDRYFCAMPFSGHYLFVLDTVENRLAAVFATNGTSITRLAPGELRALFDRDSSMPLRSDAGIHGMRAVPYESGQVYMMDGKNNLLVTLELIMTSSNDIDMKVMRAVKVAGLTFGQDILPLF